MSEGGRLAPELALFSRVAEAVSSTLDLDRVLDVVVREVGVFVGADAVSVWLLDTDRNAFVLHAARGLDPASIGRATIGWDEGVRGAAAAHRQVAVVPDVAVEPRFTPAAGTGEERYRGLLAVPLLFEGRSGGILCLQTLDPRTFEEGEQATLEAVGHQVAHALHHARLFAEASRLSGDLSRRVRELTILHLVSKNLQGPLTLDEILFVVLTGITSGKGLGYNRALILLSDPAARTLKGAMGIGPTMDEVDRVWRTATARFDALEDYFTSVDIGTVEPSPFNRLVRSISLPLGPNVPLPARAVVEARPFVVEDAWNDPGVDRGFVEMIRTKTFGVVPVVSKDLVIGCVVVDNCFNFKPIGPDDLTLLATMTNQAGLAIEASRLVKELNDALDTLEKTHRLLAEAEKMAAIGEVATGVAHDIRNPITAIGGFARRLARRLKDGTEREYVEIILREAARLEKLAGDALLYARGAGRSATEVDLAAILTEIARTRAADVHDRGLECYVEAEPVPRISVDKDAVEQVVLNLLQNALEATPAGGRITLSVRPDGTSVVLRVADTGCGISPADLPKVFEPFHTTKTKGTGLGLALAKKIVEAHRGRIGVESRLGEGTVFTIRFPSVKMGGE